MDFPLGATIRLKTGGWGSVRPDQQVGHNLQLLRWISAGLPVCVCVYACERE